MQIYFFINKLQKAYCYCICTNEVGEIKTEAFASALLFKRKFISSFLAFNFNAIAVHCHCHLCDIIR
jgi:hypothetical protein